jgi:hypothetical protein
MNTKKILEDARKRELRRRYRHFAGSVNSFMLRPTWMQFHLITLWCASFNREVPPEVMAVAYLEGLAL